MIDKEFDLFIKKLKEGLSFDHDDEPQVVEERYRAKELIDKLIKEVFSK